jgi:hypothetical protein
MTKNIFALMVSVFSVVAISSASFASSTEHTRIANTSGQDDGGSLPSGIDVNFERPCHTEGDDSLTDHLKFLGTRWTMTHTAYEDAACSKAYLIYELKYKVAIRDHDLNMTAYEAAYTVLTEQVARALNMISYCGFKDWKANERRVVTGLQCEDYHVPAEGDILYSFFQLSKKDEKTVQIQLGMPSKDLDGKSAERRFQELDPLAFLKQ